MQGTLSFYGAVGDGNTTLEIDRTGPIDLSPFFKKVFEEYHKRVAFKDMRVKFKKGHPEIRDINQREKELASNIFLDDKLATISFPIEDLYSMMFKETTPEKLSRFLFENMKDTEDYQNLALLQKIGTFNHDYERVNFRWCGSYVMIQPLDNLLTPKLIEDIFPPAPLKKVSVEAFNDYYVCKEMRHMNITKPYHCKYEDYLLRKLNREINEKKVIRVYDSALCDLNLFRIIAAHHLPTEHLEIKVKEINSSVGLN
jgi:hypothetical protein